jgi:hypothetical protein
VRFWVVLLSSAVFVGCDPGWRYHLAPLLEAVPVTKSEPIRVDLVRADVFSLGFDVTVTVVNTTASAIVIDSVAVIVRDARQNSLTPESSAGCTAADGGRLRLSPADTCQVSSSFRVNPGTWRANQQLRTLSVEIVAVVDGASVTNTLLLEWDL